METWMSQPEKLGVMLTESTLHNLTRNVDYFTSTKEMIEHARLIIIAVTSKPKAGNHRLPCMKEVIYVDRNYEYMGTLGFTSSTIKYKRNNMIKFLQFTEEFLNNHVFTPERLRATLEVIMVSFATMALQKKLPPCQVCLKRGRVLHLKVLEKCPESILSSLSILWRICLRWFFNMPFIDSASKYVRFINGCPDSLCCVNNKLVRKIKTTSTQICVQDLQTSKTFWTSKEIVSPFSNHGVVYTGVKLHHNVQNHMHFSVNTCVTSQGHVS